MIATAPDTAEGEVLVSNDPQTLEPGPVAIRLMPYGMATLQNAGQEVVLCGPRYIDEAPQAIIDQTPCGA